MSYLLLSSGSMTILQAMAVLVMSVSSAAVKLTPNYVSSPHLRWDIHISPHAITLSLVVLTVLIGVSLYSVSYMDSDSSTPRFVVILGAFSASMVLLCTSSSVTTLILGWDGLGVTSYFLVAHYPSDNAKFSSFITMFTNRLGDSFLILFLITSALNHHPTYNFGGYGPWVPLLPGLFLILACCTKSAVFPFSSWLPEAMAAPTPVSSLVHSSTLVLGGIWIYLEFFPSTLLILSLALSAFFSYTSLYSAISALYCQDVKKVVALSTLSQVSFMGMVVSWGLSSLALFHMVTHAMFKSSLFMTTGTIMHLSSGSQDIRSHLTSEESKTHLWCFSLSLGSMAALPTLSGYFSKESVIFSSCHHDLPTLSVLSSTLGGVLTLLYSIRVLVKQSSLQSSSTSSSSPQDPWSSLSFIHLISASLIGGGLLVWVYDQVLASLPTLSGWVLAGVILGSTSSIIPGTHGLHSQALYLSSMGLLKPVCTSLPSHLSPLRLVYSVWDKGILSHTLSSHLHTSFRVHNLGHKFLELGFNHNMVAVVIGLVVLSHL